MIARPVKPRILQPWSLLLLATALALLTGGWTVASSRSNGDLPASGGSYTEGVVGATPQRLSPLFAGSGPEQDVAALVFSGLTRPGPNGEPEPDLAESWVVSTDGTSFTFILRQDVLWHDGAPFTADDVLFTAKTFAVPGVKGDPSTAEVWRRASFQRLGPYAILVEFDSPYVPFLAYSSVGILPQHLLGKDSPEQLVDDQFNRRPVGTGPYRFRAMKTSSIELEPNAAYYLGAPYLRRLTLRFLPDTQNLLSALRARRVDGGILPPPLAAAELDRLRGSGHTLIGGLRSAYSLVYLNLNLAQFQDATVRKALDLATDRDSIVQRQMDGQATTADVPLPPGTWSGTDTPAVPNPGGARTLLQESGWTPGPDGILQRRGISLSFALQTTSDPQRQAIASALAAQWRAIGVDARVATIAEPSLLTDVLLPHKYEAVLYGWDSGPDPDPFPAWHSSQRGEQGRNLSGYANGAVDQLLQTARQTADLHDRAEIYGAFANVFRQDMPAIVLFFPRYVYAVPRDLNGVRLGLLSSPADRFSDVEEWSLDVRRH